MKINDDLYILELPMQIGERTMVINLSLIVDPEHGATLVDTGFPGQEDQIEEALQEAGLTAKDLKYLLITHQDLDHVGSLEALRLRGTAIVQASEIEVPYIQKDLPGYKVPPPERLAQMPEFKAMLDLHLPTHVDDKLTDGQRLEIAGGVQVIATPGHTLGHISLYLERSKVLITGDAMVSNEGTLQGPMEMATPDMATAMLSVKKLAELDVETIVCYHGGLVTQDANAQLQRVAAG